MDVELKTQHLTTGTKFEIARCHIDKLFSLFPAKKITDLIELSYDEKTNQWTIFVFNLPSYLACLSEYDSFLYSLRSCIDSFLLEVNLVYGLKIPSNQVNLTRVRKEMRRQYGKDDLTNHLISSFQSSWFKYLGSLRNFVAHRICSSFITSNDYRLYLPDDPEASKVSTNRNLEFFATLNELLMDTENFLETGFKYLQSRF